MNLYEITERIKSFAFLGKDWNDKGDVPPNQKTIDLALKLAPNFDEWFVAPGSDGSIEFEKDDQTVSIYCHQI
jgi:hypothetical protein